MFVFEKLFDDLYMGEKRNSFLKYQYNKLKL